MSEAIQGGAPMLAPRMLCKGRKSERPLVLYGKHRKAKSFFRSALLEMQACAVRVLELLVGLIDSDNKCWLQDDEIATALPRSAKRTTYSRAHVRRVLRDLHAVGIVRWKTLKPGDKWPNGKRVEDGGRIFEVNMDALCGTGPLWTPTPLTSPELAALARTAWARGEARRGARLSPRPVAASAPAVDVATVEEPSPEDPPDVEAATALPPEPPPPAPPEPEIIHDRGGTILHDPPSDQTPSESNSPDPAGATSGLRERALTGAETSANAGNPLEVTQLPPKPERTPQPPPPVIVPQRASPAQIASETPPVLGSLPASRSGPRYAARELKRVGEHASGHIDGELTADGAPMFARDRAMLDALLGTGWRADHPDWRRRRS
jgi:hypothetical protein